MKRVTVLVSASGAPGTAALLKGLRANGERDVRIVGTDMSERSVGRHLADAFHLVPAGSDPGFADAVLELVEREGVDVVLPQSSFDLEGLAAHRDRFPVPVLVSSPDAIRRTNDKAETYELLQRLGLRGPEFRRVNGAAESVMLGTEGGCTVTVVDWLTFPPGPLQLSVYVPLLVKESRTCEPEISLSPSHAPLALHAVAFSAFHERVAVPPAVTLSGVALKVNEGKANAGILVASSQAASIMHNNTATIFPAIGMHEKRDMVLSIIFSRSSRRNIK